MLNYKTKQYLKIEQACVLKSFNRKETLKLFYDNTLQIARQKCADGV